MDQFDVVIVGTGTAGYTVAKHCAQAGKSVAFVERDVPGGTCALRGCQPKKFFVVQAELNQVSQHLAGKGVGRPLELAWPQTAAFKKDFTDAVPGKVRSFFEKIGAELVPGTATLAAPGIVQVGSRQLKAGAVVLATGASPRHLEIPGAELALDSRGFLDLDRLPASLVFIGGGYISFEFAHVAAAFGARVTILNRSDRVLTSFDTEATGWLVEATRHAGIDLQMGQEPEAIERQGDGLTVRCHGGASFTGEAVVAAVGREANLEALNLEAFGVEPDPRGLIVDARMRVKDCPWLYAVGDCVRTPSLAPVADREAMVAADGITGGDASMDYRVVPSVCFAQPPLAMVGLTEDQAREKGLLEEVKSGQSTAWANQQRIGAVSGAFKVLIGKEGKILGAHILGHQAADQINLFALAMEANLPAAVFQEMMWAYPTFTADTKYMV